MMEGGGEGVVAVVRWLSDAGLAVGLLSRTPPWRPAVERASKGPSGRAPTRRVRCEPRASQTFPEREDKRSVSPEPYASTYQVTHCGVAACPHTHWHTEFPPQRRKPSPELGNFEVGHRSHSPAHSDIYSCRVERDTACLCRPRQDRDVEAFVSSLRKYPSVTERTPSADLLEKLLKTSHTRPSKESQPPSKKRRHHWDKPQPLSPLSLYASRRTDRNFKPGQAKSDPKQKTYGLEKYPLPGPVSITAFDYLNSGTSSPKTPHKKLEIKQLKNAFRVSQREKRPVTAFPLCPILRSRFEKHLKQCHPTSSKAPHVDCSSLEACTKCLQRRPCPCDIGKVQRWVVGRKNLTPKPKAMSIIMRSETFFTIARGKEEQEKRQFEDAIFSWLKDIPIYPNENPHDKFIRDAIVKKLAETIRGMSNSEFDIKGKEEIEKALKKMPMWFPNDESERERFKMMITDSLMEKIKSIKEMKSFNQATEDFFADLKFDKEMNREQVLSNIIAELNEVALNRPEDDNIYRDLLKMKTFELLDPLPLKVFGNKYEYLNELSDKLADHLVNPHLDQEKKQHITDETRDILDHAHTYIKDRDKVEESLRKLVADIAIKDMDDEKAESLIKCLLEGNVSADKIQGITDQILALADEVKPTHVKLNEKTKRMIKEFVRDVLDDSGVEVKNRVKIEEGLRNIVYDVATKRIDKDTAVDLVKALLKGKVPEYKHGQITNQISELIEEVKPMELDEETKDMIKSAIHDILDSSGAPIKDREKLEKSLHKFVFDVVTKGIEEDEAVDLMKSILRGNVPDHIQDDISDQILELANQVKPTQLNRDTKQLIKDYVRDIVNNSGASTKNKAKLEEKLHGITHDVITKRIDENQAVAKIKSLLNGKVAEYKQDDITDKILEFANEVSTQLEQETLTLQPLDKETKQIIKSDICDILDSTGVKIKDREKIEKTLNTIVHDAATKGIDEDKVETMVKSLLKGKVPEDQQHAITSQILELANQVKPDQAQPLETETKQKIKGNIRDILNIPGAKIKDKEKIEKTLNTIIHDAATKGIDEDKVEAMVKSLLKGKVPEDQQHAITSQILELANQVKPDQAQPLDKETKQKIKGDIRDILDIPGAKIKDKEKIEKKLNTIILDAASKGMDEDKVEAMVKSLLKGKVPEDQQDIIMNQVLELANQVKQPSVEQLDKETKQMIEGDIHDILDIPGTKIKDKAKMEKSLTKIVHDAATTGMDADKIEAMVKTLLKGKVPEDKQDDITSRILTLTNQVKPPQLQPLDKETKQMIKGDVREMLDLSGTPIKNRENVEKKLIQIVHDAATSGMNDEKVEAMVKSVLKGKVSEDKQDEIISQMLELANQVKPAQEQPLNKETKQMIKEDVSGIFDLSKSHVKNRSQVEENVREVISSMISKGVDDDKAKSRLKSILKGKVSDDDIEVMSNKFLELANKMKARQSKYDPKFQETLKNDITDILIETDVPVKNRSKVEESLRDILSDLVMRGMDKHKAEEYIHNTLKGNVSDSQAKEISKKILALGEQRSRSFSQDNSGPLASSSKDEEKIYHDQVYGTTRNWLKKMGIALKDEQINEVAEAIANETLDRQKYLQLNPGVKFSEKKESEILKEQIYKALNKSVDKKSVQSIMSNAEDLMNSLRGIPSLQVSRDSSRGLVQDSLEFVQENLEGALLNWLKGSPIYQSRYEKNKQAQEQMMSKLAKALADLLSSQAMMKPGAKSDEALLKEIVKHLEELPLEPHFKSKDYIRKLGAHMLDYLKSLQLFQDISARGSLKDSQRTNSSLMPTTNQLNAVVNDWCESIPLPSTDESFRMQQDLANKIILKIGEINMNQDIFNDDSLYEEVLQDFIDQQANALDISQYLTEDYKRILIDQIKQVKQKVQDDLVGRAYKQQLRETISNTLPSMTCPTVEDLAAFELMKENLADAFINLNYSGENEELRAKYKRKIIDEINKYVNDYLRRCPAPPVNTRKLNEDLYKALVNVPVPGDESMRSEVETVRMKEVINDWLKTIPMNKQSKSELLRTNKIITLMAQKLQELENEYHPDFEEIAVQEVTTYLKKLPLKSKTNLEGIAKKLVEKLKTTAESRSFVQGTRSKLTDDCLCIDLPAPHVLAQPSNLSCVSFIPPCGLSKEDKELLQRIRERSLLCETGTQLRKCKDAAVNPPPLDHGSQTEMPCQSKCCQHTDKPEPVCSKSLSQKTNRIPVCTRPFTSTGSQADVSPYVVVKEYYWDSASGNKESATQTPIQESGRICLPSSPVSPAGICRSRECMTRRPIRPRSNLENPSCRRAPRKQFSSACPNECFNNRPKPHNCLKSRPCSERDYLRSQCKRVPANRPRRKSSCLSCQDPTQICPDCFPMHVCPHPTCLYFK